MTSLPPDVVVAEQRWHDAVATRERKRVIDNAEAYLLGALQIVAELRQTDLAVFNDHTRWKLAWELNATVHEAQYPLFSLVNDERDEFFARRTAS
ncbi:MAG: hypothetical protein QOK28_2015 [Actinomycetota bacterium]|jgi:hypothetical protein